MVPYWPPPAAASVVYGGRNSSVRPAARILGMSRGSLYSKLRALGLGGRGEKDQEPARGGLAGTESPSAENSPEEGDSA